MICAAAFLILPNHRLALAAFLSTISLHLLLQYLPTLDIGFPELNYFVCAMWVILIAFMILAIPTIAKNGIGETKKWLVFADNTMKQYA